MKLVIFSDSHGDVETMCGVVEKEEPDMIIHLGDGIADTEQLNEKYPGIEMITVLGNTDSDREDEEWIKHAEICGKRFIITHGHTFINEFAFSDVFNTYRQTDENRVSSRENMLKAMNENGAAILLYGHTHEPYISRTEAVPGKVCWIMNPGSIRRKGGIFKPVYGVLMLDESGVFEWRFTEVE